ncbi:MAG: bifunctional metallophosphatase/5'-nucleotidase [Muribaculaceae bacterium]
MNKKLLVMLLLGAASLCGTAEAQRITILSANDTHSAVLPADDGMGGLLRQKALVDSVRRADENVVAVHAGDAVQGTVYFSMFRGEIEYALHDSIGYDYCVLGNHEFDNGIEELAQRYKGVKACKLSANYDMASTPLDGMFVPYHIRRYGDKRIAFMGINLEPKGMIADKNVSGLIYNDARTVALKLSEYLKTTGLADYVVMISHIGYADDEENALTDCSIVKSSRYIDLVIGGHSHTLIGADDSLHLVKNADGRPIPMCQAGRYGKYVTKTTFDLSNGSTEYELLPVDARYDAAVAANAAMRQWLKPYDERVHEVMTKRIATSECEMFNTEVKHLSNFVTDAVKQIVVDRWGKEVDFAIMNRGGIRQSLPKGDISEGMITSMLPFDNRLTVLRIKGSDLMEAFGVMASRGGDAVSKEVEVKMTKNKKVEWAKFKGKKIDPKATYTIVTVDYLANGGDYMVPLTRAERLFEDDVPYGGLVLEYVKQLDAQGKTINPEGNCRMHF